MQNASPFAINSVAVYSGHRDCIYAMCAGFRADTFITSGADGLIVEWDLHKPDEGRLLAQVEGSVYALFPSKEEEVLYVGHNFKGVHRIAPIAGKELNSAAITNQPIFDLVVWKGLLFAACGDGQLVIMHAEDLSVIRKVPISTKSLRCLSLHPLLPILTIGTSDFGIYHFDLETGVCAEKHVGHQNSVFTVCYDFKGNLFSAGRDAMIVAWQEGKPVKKIAAHLYSIHHLAMHDKGNLMASASMDKSIKLWDMESLELLKVIDKGRHAGHGTSVNKVLWLPGRDLLISAGDDRSIRIWNIAYKE
jgi:WD40 repeat protein